MASDLIDRGELFPHGFIIVDASKSMQVLNDLINRIYNAQAVDAVEVVRCMNCIHKRNEGTILRCPFSTVALMPGGYCDKGIPNAMREGLQNIKEMEKKKRVFEEGGWGANETEESGEGVRE